MESDLSVCATRNVHGWTEEKLKNLSKNWQNTPEHFNKLDLRGFLQDKEITQVEMEDAEPDENNEEKNNEKMSDISSKSSENEDEVRFLTKTKSDFAVIID